MIYYCRSGYTVRSEIRGENDPWGTVLIINDETGTPVSGLWFYDEHPDYMDDHCRELGRILDAVYKRAITVSE